MYKFHLNESDQCRDLTGLGFAKGPSLIQAEWQPISSNNYQSSYQWQQILNGQYIKMSVNGASTIICLVSTIIEK